MSHVNLDNATRPGDDTYKKVIEQIHQEKICPFCPEHLSKFHKHPILLEGNRWRVTTNMYPYKGTKYHFLFIHREHITDTANMPQESFIELRQHINQMVKENNIPGGTLMMRCGDTTHTGASVTHIHAHFVVPDFENPYHKPVRVRIG
jgi:diadenosine tetraphosphate (Ap4A) HIT family hydrolase